MRLYFKSLVSLVFLITLSLPYSVFAEKPKIADIGKTLFNTKCIVCHTIGKGKRIGPDLKGVAKRKGRTDAWLKKMIKDPASMLKNDPIAKKLLKEHNGIPMVGMGLTDAQVDAVIEFIKKQ